VNVFDLPCERRADARERLDHEPDQGAVAKTNGFVTSIASSNARASEGSSTGVLLRFTLCEGPRTDAAGFIVMT
jgi:hypothetical protein